MPFSTNPVALRIKEFANDQGISVSKFEKRIKAGNGWVRRLRDTPKASRLEIIGQTFPQLNINWMLTGEGEMLNEQPRYTASPSKVVPRIPASVASAVAGSLSGYAEGVGRNECEFATMIEQFPRYDLTLAISGESMEPRFLSGDELALRRIEANALRYGETYVLSTADGAVLKRIYPSENEDRFRLVSFNPDYPPYEIARDQILEAYQIVGILRRLQ